MKQKIGLIFDLDGTLWDSSTQVTESWNIVLCRHKNENGVREFITDDDMQSYMGLTMDDIFLKMLPDCDSNLRFKIQKECQQEENDYLETHSGTLYPEVENTLLSLKNSGYHLYIVSNCQNGYIQSFLKSSGLSHYFEDYEMFGRTNLLKSDNIKLIMQRNELDSAVYVGDIQADCDSTHAAGIKFIHASYGFGKVCDAEYVIKCFHELPSIVEKIY